MNAKVFNTFLLQNPISFKKLFCRKTILRISRIIHNICRNLKKSTWIGIPYRPDQEPNDIKAIGEGVRKVYEEVLVPAGMGDVAIYTEFVISYLWSQGSFSLPSTVI